MKVITALMMLLASVHGHGYLTYPPSRTRLAFEAGKDSCPECSILEPVPAWPDVTGAKVGNSGPCGFNQRSKIDYNQPGSNWGQVVQTFKRGEVIDVQWCVDHNGDHAGMYSFRICQDEALVKKFITPGYLPNAAEKQQAEDCFQRGILPCTSVDGQSCKYNPNCSPGQPCWRNDWFSCGDFYGGRCKTPYVFPQSDLQASSSSSSSNVTNPFCDNSGPRNDCGYVGITEQECASRACCWNPVDGKPWCFNSNSGGGGGGGSTPPSTCKTTIAQGYTVNAKVKIPNYASNHTLLSLRWNAFETPQIYLFCSDIAIV